MSILVTNDDGVNSEGLRALASELSRITEVTVVAPSREQSAIGTAVTLRQMLRVQKIAPLVPEVETYAVDGTPSDSVLLALGKVVSFSESAGGTPVPMYSSAKEALGMGGGDAVPDIQTGQNEIISSVSISYEIY